jgi:hypothetical protein
MSSEGEQPGQIPLLSQDCYASFGLPISAIGSAPPPPAPGNTAFVSTFTANPAEDPGGLEAAVVTGSLYITDADGVGSIGLQLAAISVLKPASSKVITFETLSYDSPDTGVVGINATTWTDVLGNPQTGVSVEVLSTATLLTVNPACQAICNSVYADELLTADLVNVSSINGVSWAQISTAAGTLG